MTDLLGQAEEKIQELIESAEDLADEAENYLDVATAIDNRKKDNDPRSYVPLDDLPFGEERARLGGTPDALRSLVSELKSLPLDKLTVRDLDKRIEEAEEEIEGVKSTIQECTPLPSEDDEDDGGLM